jgi:hypothetical protein
MLMLAWFVLVMRWRIWRVRNGGELVRLLDEVGDRRGAHRLHRAMILAETHAIPCVWREAEQILLMRRVYRGGWRQAHYDAHGWN